jgi:hypothetical protein
MGTVTTYPNGQQLISSAMTVPQMNVLMQATTCGMIGINPVDVSQVRADWPTQGQPFGIKPSQDVCFLSCVPWNTNYSGIRDRVFTNVGGQVQENWLYNRGWRVAWVLYGPNAEDRARALRSAFFMDYFNDLLSISNLYPVNDPSEVVYVPELINAEWWQRADFEINFYEQVTETILDGVVTSVEVKVYDGSPNDPVADVTITNT